MLDEALRARYAVADHTALHTLHCVHAQGRTGPYFQDFNDDLIEDLLARYPNLVRPSTLTGFCSCALCTALMLHSTGVRRQ